MGKRGKGNGRLDYRREFYSVPLPSCKACKGFGKVCVCCNTHKDHQAGMRDCVCLMSIPEPKHIRNCCDSTEFYVVMVLKTYLTYDEWHEAVGAPVWNA